MIKVYVAVNFHKLLNEQIKFVIFQNTSLNEESVSINISLIPLCQPIPASIRHVPTLSARKRKVFPQEPMNSGNRTRIRLKKLANRKFINMLKGRNFNRTCESCKDKGHNRSRCLRIEQDHKYPPLPLHDSSMFL